MSFETHPNRAIEKRINELEEEYFFYEEMLAHNLSSRAREMYKRKAAAISFQVVSLQDELTPEDE